MSENFTTMQRFDFLPFIENKHFLNYVQIKLFDCVIEIRCVISSWFGVRSDIYLHLPTFVAV